MEWPSGHAGLAGDREAVSYPAGLKITSAQPRAHQLDLFPRSLPTISATANQQTTLIRKDVTMIGPTVVPIPSVSRMSKQKTLPGNKKTSAKSSPVGFPCGLPVRTPIAPTTCASPKITQNAFQFISFAQK